MGIKLEEIRHGLRTFDTTYFQAPGRTNVFDEHPFKVILDYGHNAPAVEAMVQLIDRLEPEGRRLVVMAGPGDRRDEDIRDIAKACAGHFDHYICRRDDVLRGRQSDEVPLMLRQTLLDHGVTSDRIDVIPDEAEAVDHGLGLAKPGDLLLIFADNVTRSWKQIIGFTPQHLPAAAEEKVSPPPPPDVPAIPIIGDWDTLVRDERGVRLARETED